MKTHVCLKKCLIVLIFLYHAMTLSQAKSFIFDFGGVLVLNDKITSLRRLGVTNIASCSFRLGINPLLLDHHIKSKLFSVLNEISSIHNLGSEMEYHGAFDEKGNELPYLFCAWLQGAVTSTTIRTLATSEIDLHPEWFGCPAEQRIVLNLVNLIFTPEEFVNAFKISRTGLAFVKKCKREGHNVYGLSNWDAESFALLRKKHAELFDLFDGIIVSGQVHANKPHATIYHILLDRYNLTPENCWFIDDQEENIIAAQKLGINAIRHVSNFKKLIQNIRLAYASLRKNRIITGIIANNANTTNNIIIDGEKISLTDSTDDNCLPAKA